MFSGKSDAFNIFTEGHAEDYSNINVSLDTSKTMHRKRPALASNDAESPAVLRKLSSRKDTFGTKKTTKGRDDELLLLGLENDGESSLGPRYQKQKQKQLDSSQITPMPTVTDAFEQDLKREVATSAGLTGKVEGSSIILDHQVRHQVALPPNWNYIPIQQHTPGSPRARTYPFTLDPFQQLSTYCIERDESVLVSAHTSAGKTVVAEFAIAASLKAQQRVIYTSPIKALSNQKYRELEAHFEDVGLMTGEVTINPSASCLVMTTEILRSMLYRGSEVMREVAWVIFDEIHYLKDPERGVVWEETIIMLPRNCHYVFLSATIPNAMEFAEWICKIKEQPCHVVSTNFRPTPLQHYLFAQGDTGIRLVVNEKGEFKEASFREAIAAVGPSESLHTRGDRAKQNEGPTDIYKIVKMIQSRMFYPVIVFSFSKSECEAYSRQVKHLEFNSLQETEMVDQVVNNALSQLSTQDRELPQIVNTCELLRRGIGVHHAGLLPILKEVIEILFQEGLLKALFATETFSIGLNMPAKTVVFTNVQKFDGTKKRWITGGEYIQMSGRAGRRGLDERGIVIMMIDEKLDSEVARKMVLGATDPLNSAFRLSYQMILSLILVEGASPEYMTQMSFITFQTRLKVAPLERQLAALENEKKAIVVAHEDSVAAYHALRQQLDEAGKRLKEYFTRGSIMSLYLTPGRIVRIFHEGHDYGWSIVTKKPIYYTMHGIHIFMAMLATAPGTVLTMDSRGVATGLKPCPAGQECELIIAPLPSESITGISSTSVTSVKQTGHHLRAAHKNLEQLQSFFPDGLPYLDLIEDVPGLAGDMAFRTLVRKIEMLETQLFRSPVSKLSPSERKALYEPYLQKLSLAEETIMVERALRRAVASVELKELHQRKRVLRMLGYINHADVIELKGRVACEISNKDVLVMTELLFTGSFGKLAVPQIVALLSCFAFSEKIDREGLWKAELEVPKQMLQDAAKVVAKVTKECLIEIEEVEYVQSFRTELMDVVYAWSN
ncbi:ATP-dependent RNA helicase mtr4, partial [Podila humilis]